MLYRVKVEKKVTLETTVEVEACSKDEAKIRAELLAENSEGWEETELNWLDSYIISKQPS